MILTARWSIEGKRQLIYLLRYVRIFVIYLYVRCIKTQVVPNLSKLCPCLHGASIDNSIILIIQPK